MPKRISKADVVRHNAIMIVSNIAFELATQNGIKVLRATDINNLKYKADFRYDSSIRRFNEVSSTFSDGKRKYEMLYILERNTEEIYEIYKDA